MYPNYKRTAPPRTSPSLPMRYLYRKGLLYGDMLDYGSGLGFDANYYRMDSFDIEWHPDYSIFNKKYDVITCNFVLNVVPEETQNEIISQIYKLLKNTGTSYFSVSRYLKNNTITKWTEQRLVYLPFESIHTKKGVYELYKMRREDYEKFLLTKS